MKTLLISGGADFSLLDIENGYLHALRDLGHETIHYALNRRIDLSSSWLEYVWKKNGKNPETHPSLNDILYLAGQGVLERALRHQVEGVIVISGIYMHPDWLILMRRAGVPVVCMFTESPYDDEKEVVLADFVNVSFVNERTSVERFKPHCPRTYYLQHAYDPNVIEAVKDDSNPIIKKYEQEVRPLPSHDVVFVGTGFQERIDLLAGVNWDGIDLGLYGTWSLIGSRSKLRKYIKGGVMPNHMAHVLYRRSKIGLNLYRTSSGFGKDVAHVEDGESLNPRAVELAAAGVFTISTPRPEVMEVFGELVPTCTTSKELEEAIRYYLSHKSDRQAIAHALPDKVQGFTYQDRAQTLAEILHPS